MALRRMICVLSLIALVLLGSAWTYSAARASSHSAKANIGYVTKQIAKFKAVPKFAAPGPAFNAKKARGKSIYDIPVSTQIPFLQSIEQSMKAIAKRMGIKLTIEPTTGQPTQWVQGMNQAIAQKVNLIILDGAPDPYTLQPQLRAAKAAHIPVEVTHVFDESAPMPPNVTALVPVSFNKAARLEADYAIKKGNGKVDAWILTANELVPSKGIVAAMQDEFAKRCGSTCTTTVSNIPSSEWESPRPLSETESALKRDPNINFIIPIYDSMSQFVVPGIKAVGAINKTHIVTFNGTPFVMKMVEDGHTVLMDIAEDLDWLGYADMDQAMRILTGHKPLKSEHTPLRLFDSSNIHEAGTPPRASAGFGKSYVKGYQKLWGLAK